MECVDVSEAMSSKASFPQAQTNRKRTRKHSEVKNAPAFKRSRLQHHPQSISSTQLANNVMKFRLGGSVSDPLNLEGTSGNEPTDGECSTCAPSPALPSGQPSPLPQYLQRDPLNLEGKVKGFPLHKQHLGATDASQLSVKQSSAHKKRTRYRKRSSSKSEDQDSIEENKKSLLMSSMSKPVFRFGNYDRYYGYRNSGVSKRDLRVSLLRREWFEGKDCLDIGSNTGQITIKIARDFQPRKIVGIDIDSKLVRIALKNVHRDGISAVTPDGRPFPQSLLLSRGPPVFPSFTTSTGAEDGAAIRGDTVAHTETRDFPHNIEFRQGNYVPDNDFLADCQEPEFDTILALSLTKWIHLNWGDAGIKRFFRKISNHLRPGGRLILEPQPYTSYCKKKKLTPEIFAHYQSISFFPRDFHSYLLSSEVGFTEHQLLGVPDNQSKGFRRPIHLYTKSNTCPVQDAAIPETAASNKKLKSVVGEVSKTFSLVAPDTCTPEDMPMRQTLDSLDTKGGQNISGT